MSEVSTHVLDTARGEPATGIVVRLERVGADFGAEVGRGVTDADGRIAGLGGDLATGVYRLVFETASYLIGSGSAEPFFPEVAVTFTIDGARPRYHVPLLLSPYAYSTYRGS